MVVEAGIFNGTMVIAEDEADPMLSKGSAVDGTDKADVGVGDIPFGEI